MKLLSIKTLSGYMMLSKNFEINFLTKTRVDRKNSSKELIELQKGFYYPVQTILIGKNSSGKTTTLKLISLIIEFINVGRIESSDFNELENFIFEFKFYNDGSIYKYYGSFVKNSLINNKYLIIEDEKLGIGKVRTNTKKDLSNLNFSDKISFKPNIGNDTSSITTFNFEDFSVPIDKLVNSPQVFYSLIKYINNIYKSDIFSKIVNLFDDSIEYIRVCQNENGNLIGFLFKRFDNREIQVECETLKKILSSGTYRGIFIFSMSILAFYYGGHVLIDEIENSFNKNLIENLIALFEEPRINKKGATLIYSTHYSELLNETKRCDNINVLHRIKNLITLKNLSSDFDCRVDILKSSQFDQNTFDNNVNYENLMNLRRELLK